MQGAFLLISAQRGAYGGQSNGLRSAGFLHLCLRMTSRTWSRSFWGIGAICVPPVTLTNFGFCPIMFGEQGNPAHSAKGPGWVLLWKISANATLEAG